MEIHNDQDAASTAVSLFGSGGRDEFPVLKAFQQYIDAEQAKARKRMFGLSAFFIILLVIVTVTFVVVLGWLIQRNLQLEDRIFAMTEKERDRSVEQSRILAERTEEARKAGAAAATAAMEAASRRPIQEADAYIRPILDRMEKDRQVHEQALETEKKKIADEKERLARERAESEKKAAEEKLKAERDRVKAEKEKAALEKERIRQEEIERHRRRLYPEYYARKEKLDAEARQASHSSLPPPPPSPQPVKQTIQAPARKTVQSVRMTATESPVRTVVPEERVSSLDTLKPISYFEEETVPAEEQKKMKSSESVPKKPAAGAVKAVPSKNIPKAEKKAPKKPEKKYMTLKVEDADGDSTPFLLETTEDK